MAAACWWLVRFGCLCLSIAFAGASLAGALGIVYFCFHFLLSLSRPDSPKRNKF